EKLQDADPALGWAQHQTGRGLHLEPRRPRLAPRVSHMPELEVRFGEPRDMPWKEVLPGNVLSAKTCCKCANEVAHPSPFLSQRLARQSPDGGRFVCVGRGPRPMAFRHLQAVLALPGLEVAQLQRKGTYSSFLGVGSPTRRGRNLGIPVEFGLD